jgi:hypothetical protein
MGAPSGLLKEPLGLAVVRKHTILLDACQNKQEDYGVLRFQAKN